jgi:hypothetical protein
MKMFGSMTLLLLPSKVKIESNLHCSAMRILPNLLALIPKEPDHLFSASISLKYPNLRERALRAVNPGLEEELAKQHVGRADFAGHLEQ